MPPNLHRDTPCSGCLVSLPPPAVQDAAAQPAEPAVPLLVVLHGDAESPQQVFDAWAAASAAHGIAVLAPACPREQGCTARSWWQWNGSPGWLLDQVRAVSQELKEVDPARMALVGWSGGASYIGYRTQEFEAMFPAFVLHGGGIPPASEACASPGASTYFLVGTANPLHAMAVRLRDHYAGCGADVTWTELSGVDHPGERRALGPHREAILGWLEAKWRSAAARVAAQRVVGGAGVPDPIRAATEEAKAQAATGHVEDGMSAAEGASKAAVPGALSGHACACAFPGAPSVARSPTLMSAAAVCVALLASRGRGCARRPRRTPPAATPRR